LSIWVHRAQVKGIGEADETEASAEGGEEAMRGIVRILAVYANVVFAAM
jgi:hypothetical protein